MLHCRKKMFTTCSSSPFLLNDSNSQCTTTTTTTTFRIICFILSVCINVSSRGVSSSGSCLKRAPTALVNRGDTHLLHDNLHIPHGDVLIHGGDLSTLVDFLSSKKELGGKVVWLFLCAWCLLLLLLLLLLWLWLWLLLLLLLLLLL